MAVESLLIEEVMLELSSVRKQEAINKLSLCLSIINLNSQC